MGIHSVIRASVTSGIVVFHSTVQMAAIGLLITSAVSAGLAWFVTKRLTKDHDVAIDSDGKELSDAVRNWWAFGAFVDASLFFLPAGTLWIVMAFSPDQSELAVLTASYVLGQAMIPLLQAVNRGFVRLTALENEASSTDRARGVLSNVLDGLLPLAGFVLLFSLFAGAWLVTVLFGTQTDVVWWVPGVVVLGMLGLSFSHLLSESLGNAGWLKQRCFCVLTISILSLAVTVELSRRWGTLGGAVAIGVTGCGLPIALGALLRGRLGSFWPWKGTLSVILSTGLAVMAGFISGPIRQENWYFLPTLVLTYCIGLILTDNPAGLKLVQSLKARIGIA
jgi:O-antigen/teichoic acid export membrane protein